MRGGARPYLGELLQTASKLKENNLVDEVLIFTAADNSSGWVDFLKNAMEIYTGTTGMFRWVFHRTSCGAGIYKDLRLVYEGDDRRILLIDDRPTLAVNGIVLGIPAYHNHNPVATLMQDIIRAFTRKHIY